MPISEQRLALNRRALLRLGAVGGAAGALAAIGATNPAGAQSVPAVSTQARIVIAGAGAAGLAAANQLARRLDGARITLIDGRKAHYYQPGFT